MKLLIVQLARFGDIFSTWPVVRALQRQRPECEIHLLVRERFRAAADGLDGVVVHTLPTGKILEPLAHSSGNTAYSLNELRAFVTTLKAQDFSEVYNLTFSPFSSYLTNAISTSDTTVYGYHRYSDGHLAITDEISAYFYAQVGITRQNRFHVIDLFAQLCQVQLQDEDWRGPKSEPIEKPEGRYFVVHLGASQNNKRLSPQTWKRIVEKLVGDHSVTCVLVGSKDEVSLANELDSNPQIVNYIGQTSLRQLFSIIEGAEFLLGGDSGPIHVASLVNTPVLNISFKSVNFWETGPRAPGSRILWYESPEQAKVTEILDEAESLLTHRAPTPQCIYVDKNRTYIPQREMRGDPEWSLIEFIYCGTPAPQVSRVVAQELFVLNNLNQMCVEQISILSKNPKDETANAIYAQSDVVLDIIKKRSPFLAIIVRWFETEKVRIEPGSFLKVLERTYHCHQGLTNVITALMNTVSVEIGEGNESAIVDT